MIKLLIGMLFITTTALAQTAQTPSDQKRARVADKPSGSTESTTRSKAKATTASARPLPQPPLKEKLESGNSANPMYKKAKDAGVRKTSPKYPPRRSKSGVRKDTMSNIKL